MYEIACAGDDEGGLLQTAMAEVAASAADAAAARPDGCILSCSPHVSVWRRRLPSSAVIAGAQQQQAPAGDPKQDRSPFTSPLRQSLQRQYSQGDGQQGLPSQDAVRKLVSHDSFGSHAAAKTPSEGGPAAPGSTGRHSRAPSHGAPNEARLQRIITSIKCRHVLKLTVFVIRLSYDDWAAACH